MEKAGLEKIMQNLFDHKIDTEMAMKFISDLPFHDMGFASVDHHRSIRTGVSEVIFCQGKTEEQILAIVRRQLDHDETVFGTRASEGVLKAVESSIDRVEMNRAGRCFWIKSSLWKKSADAKGDITVISAGTSDSAVVEEARCTVELLGHPCTVIQDVGVAGIHRLFAHHETMRKASVIIVVAGMEGALPSVVAGLVSCPVIGVPTSVGYGTHLNGLVPLFAMLNSCATGLTIVNVDNGFGAACAAVRINKKLP